jgi:glycosyltransferase involved in cell wall biosynthesis
MPPKLTIITVNLNNREGLRRTLNSVFIQTFTDFEYIIIDGASTDGSVDLIKESSNHFTYWVSEPDSGVYQAMNKGIGFASGEYLLFLNSGDIFVSDTALEKVFNQNHSADILICGHKLSKNEKIVYSELPPVQITFGHLYLKGINHQSTFIRRDLFLKSGLYREDFRYNADIEFWIRTIILGNASVECIHEYVSVYNLEGISSIESTKTEFQEELQKIYNHPLLQKIIPDYDGWKKEKEEMRIWNWIKSKKIVYSPLKLMFNLARLIKPNKRSLD